MMAINKHYPTTLITIEIIEKQYIYLISKVLLISKQQKRGVTSDVEENGGEKVRRVDKKRRRGRKRRRDDERLFAEHFLWNSASRRMGLFTSTFLNEESCLPASQLRVFLKKI